MRRLLYPCIAVRGIYEGGSASGRGFRILAAGTFAARDRVLILEPAPIKAVKVPGHLRRRGALGLRMVP